MPNIISVSWGDHLVFGEGDGRLDTPEAVSRRLQCWREELNASVIHWRVPRSELDGQFEFDPDHPHTQQEREKVDWDYKQVVPRLAHRLGMQVYLYVSLFDEGWPLAPKAEREKSYHNAMHGKNVAWQSTFSRANPEYTLVDRAGNRQWGVMSLAYRVVRAFFRERFENLLWDTRFDGLFVCLRSQSKPPDFADQFGFNEPIRREFKRRYGQDIRLGEFDLQAWYDLQGEYLTLFLHNLHEDLRARGLRLGVGAPRGDVIGPPLGNMTLAWWNWITMGVVDDLVINQNSSKCPSMGHDLWPMHRGFGYVQNYLDGFNLPPLMEQLTEDYAPYLSNGNPTRLFVARQWDQRDPAEEAALCAHPAVTGLVFSSFQHDHPGATKRKDWVA
ncbi:MAG: hypothetical protein Fur0022_23410 [Anaerolineales bacterium]